MKLSKNETSPSTEAGGFFKQSEENISASPKGFDAPHSYSCLWQKRRLIPQCGDWGNSAWCSCIKQYWPLLVLGLIVAIFFRKFLLLGKLPIPADTTVGMYHPWLEIVWDNLVAGTPFKNFLITDPVRQQYPWRQLAINLLKNGQLPLWNPYTFGGMPLLANFQSAIFYPFNIFFFLFPFNLVWGGLILVQPLLAGIFLYFYLRYLKLRKVASLVGVLSFSFSGFFIAWLEWGTLLQVALWLPLILLSIEKIFASKQWTKWNLVLVLALCFQFFAGHLQTSFYLVLFSLVYLIWKTAQVKKNRLKLFSLCLIPYGLSLIITSIQWLPTWELIRLSARGIDQIQFNQPGWFIPWQNLVQFLAPDFFGNPTTLNYWGVWNYAEFVGYLGVIPLVLAFYAIFWWRDKKTIFFSLLALLTLSFALPTPWAKLPYQLRIPLVATSQPTRLLFIVDFCLAVLAAFGLNALLKQRIALKKIILALMPFFLLYGLLWLFVLGAKQIWPEASWIANLAVSKRNLILPTGLFIAGGVLIISLTFKRIPQKIIFFLILTLIVFDLLRFGWKFTPFTKEEWVFPTTETIEFLKADEDIFRFMTTDRRLFAPNFSLPYKLQTVEGYDPLYLTRYAELIAASERGEPNISPPFGYNRIITPHNFQSPIIDLLNVKYVLALTDLDSPKLELVFQEGQTRVYENKNVFPRAFMVYDYQLAKNKQEVIDLLMKTEIDLTKTVVLEELPQGFDLIEGENEVTIKDYQENQVVVNVKTNQKGILILTDSFYPGWQATINGGQTKIYLVNYNFRGIIVPKGTHEVRFKYEY